MSLVQGLGAQDVAARARTCLIIYILHIASTERVVQRGTRCVAARSRACYATRNLLRDSFVDAKIILLFDIEEIFFDNFQKGFESHESFLTRTQMGSYLLLNTNRTNRTNLSTYHQNVILLR